jgi:class 3 adenylate cyclase/predicted ATPase
MTDQVAQIQNAIKALEAQRSILGDSVVNLALDSLRRKLDTLSTPITQREQQRKQVTVLFADISGFTSLSETMDAEDITDLINQVWQNLDGIIEKYGGRIDKHIGDAVMAVWGVETAREDDPERAIRCALEMLKSTLSPQGQRPSLQLRIGINTGPVLLGGVGSTQEFTAIGDTVNTANRLQTAAQPNSLLISHDTYRHVRGLFKVRALDPLTLKGKTDLQRVYSVEAARPSAFRTLTRGVEGVETRMIGRENELQTLQTEFEISLTTPSTGMVTILGEAGMGKSRLLYEFNNWIELLPFQIQTLKGRATQQSTAVPAALLRFMLSSHFNLLESDPPDILLEKLRNGLCTLWKEEQNSCNEAAVILGTWLGFKFPPTPHHTTITDARELHQRALTYLSQLFRSLAEYMPILILLEDIHWADERSLEAIQTVFNTAKDLPILIIGLARPSLLDTYPNWTAQSTSSLQLNRHTLIELHPLSNQDSQLLVAEILQKTPTIPQHLSDLIIERSEGNPYYIEEMVKILIDEGVIQIGMEQWLINTERLATINVPATLTGILQARLDSLPEEERLALQRCSVIGRIFWEDALAYLGTIPPSAILNRLLERRIIFRRDKSAFQHTQEFIFEHTLLRDVAYESVLKRERRSYHAQAAHWLVKVTQSSGRTDEYAAVIAEHYRQAGDMDAARAWYHRAATSAATRFANVEARRYYTHAIELTPTEDLRARFDLIAAREKILDLLGERQAQVQDLNAMQEIAQRLNDQRAQAEVGLRQAHFAEKTGSYHLAVDSSRSAILITERIQQPILEAAGHLQLGRALRRLGNYEEAWNEFQNALALAKELGLPQIEADCMHNLGNIYSHQGDYRSATDYYKHALHLQNDLHNRQGAGAVLNSLGIAADNQGAYTEAKAYYEQALEAFRSIGDLWGQGLAYNNLGIVCSELGDYSEARRYYQQSLNVTLQVNDRVGEALALNNLGIISDHLADYAAAQIFYDRALEIVRQSNDLQGESVTLTSQSLLHVHQQRYDQAIQVAQQAIKIAQQLGEERVQGYALTNLGHALLQTQNFDQAAQAYQTALDLRKRLGDRNLMIESLAGLATVWLAKQQIDQALQATQTILEVLQENPALNGAEEPLRVYLTCVNVLRTANHPLLKPTLQNACQLLRENAAHISDPSSRTIYLEQVPHHAALLELEQILLNKTGD